MATAQDLIRRASRIARIVDAGESLEADDAQDALDTLNAMLAEWHVAEIGLPDYQLSSLTDTLASDAADREAVAYQLALRIAGEYGYSLMPADQMLAESTFARLRLRYFQPGRMVSELPGPVSSFDTEVG